MRKIRDDRTTNGKTKAEMLKISREGKVSVQHDGHGFLSRGWALANDNCRLFPSCQCKSRCAAIDCLTKEMEAELMSLPHIESSDIFLVRQFTKLTTFQIVVDRWLEKHDIVIEKDGHLKMQGIFQQYFILANSLQRLADRLGLSPLGRKQLKAKSKFKDIAAVLAEASKSSDE